MGNREYGYIDICTNHNGDILVNGDYRCPSCCTTLVSGGVEHFQTLDEHVMDSNVLVPPRQTYVCGNSDCTMYGGDHFWDGYTGDFYGFDIKNYETIQDISMAIGGFSYAYHLNRNKTRTYRFRPWLTKIQLNISIEPNYDRYGVYHGIRRVSVDWYRITDEYSMILIHPAHELKQFFKKLWNTKI